MNIGQAPAIRWDTAHMSGENIMIHLSVPNSALHIAVISRETLEDALRDTSGDPLQLALNNQRAVEHAVDAAWQRQELRELFEVNGVRRNVQLWLDLEDFEAGHGGGNPR